MDVGIPGYLHMAVEHGGVRGRECGLCPHHFLPPGSGWGPRGPRDHQGQGGWCWPQGGAGIRESWQGRGECKVLGLQGLGEPGPLSDGPEEGEQLLLVTCGGCLEYCCERRKPWPQTWVQQPGQWGWSAYLTTGQSCQHRAEEKGQEAAPATLQVRIVERTGAAAPAGTPWTTEASVLFGIECSKGPEDAHRSQWP